MKREGCAKLRGEEGRQAAPKDVRLQVGDAEPGPPESESFDPTAPAAGAGAGPAVSAGPLTKQQRIQVLPWTTWAFDF